MNYDMVQKSQFHPDWPPPLFSSWISELRGATYLSFRESRSHIMLNTYTADNDCESD